MSDAPAPDDDATEDVPAYLVHLYRGELGRVTAWRDRLDRTVNWTVTLIAALLTWVFSSPDNPHYLLLIGMAAVAVFHLVETRRYRAFDVWRARIRLLEGDVFAATLDPESGVSHENWREELASDLRRPALKTPFLEAYARRLRRVYLPLFLILLAAWVGRVTVFASESTPIAAAALPGVPGEWVVAAVALAYLAALVLAIWPMERQATGEFRKRGKAGDWKKE